MSDQGPIVHVVDDDSSMRGMLEQLMKSAGYEVVVYPSAEVFSQSKALSDRPSCLILDMHMPGLTGLELQAQLVNAGIYIPTIFLSGFCTVQDSVRAMKGGAVDFVTKPFNTDMLLNAVSRAIEQDRQYKQHRTALKGVYERFDSLTRREREVFELVTKGMLNKQIACDLGVCEKTIKVHRAHVMQKMKVRSLADLVRLREQLKRENQVNLFIHPFVRNGVDDYGKSRDRMAGMVGYPVQGRGKAVHV